MSKKPKGKKVDAYRVAAGAFDLLQDCSRLFDAVLNKHGNEMSEAAFLDFAEAIGMLDQVTYQIYKTSIKPANADIESTSGANVENARKPRKTFYVKETNEVATRDDIIGAANKRAKDCWPDSDPAMRGWKGVVAHELKTEWRTLKEHLHHFDLTEDELVARMRAWRPPPKT